MTQPLYIVLIGSIEPYVTERDLADMGRETTIRQIADGEFKGFRAVIEFDLQAGTSRDVTAEMAREVMTRWAYEGEPLSESRYEFVEKFVSLNAARSFARECA